MMCIDEPFDLQGSFDSVKAINLMVVFEMCDASQQPSCKNLEETNDWIRQKYFVVLENQKRFN